MKDIKEAENSAERLLAQQPDAADAWLALGAAQHIIGCLTGPKRFVLGVRGIHGDRKLGLEELSRTASKGRYLEPYVKILLALAARREKKDELASELLRELKDEFPSSRLFTVGYARAISQRGPPQMPR